MHIATNYAKALRAAAAEHPNRSAELIQNLRALLKRRGHSSLLPRIFAEYETVSLREERIKRAKAVTPEGERTRVLLELYRRLTQGSTHSL